MANNVTNYDQKTADDPKQDRFYVDPTDGRFSAFHIMRLIQEHGKTGADVLHGAADVFKDYAEFMHDSGDGISQFEAEQIRAEAMSISASLTAMAWKMSSLETATFDNQLRAEAE